MNNNLDEGVQKAWLLAPLFLWKLILVVLYGHEDCLQIRIIKIQIQLYIKFLIIDKISKKKTLSSANIYFFELKVSDY